MESNWNSSLPWLQGNEQDFPLGAKATSYLLPATTDSSALRHDTFEPSEWIESHEILGLSDAGLYNEGNPLEYMKFETADDDFNHEIINGSHTFEDLEEDYSNTIRPEDMLVPLSELQPEKYASTPQGIGANTLFAASIPPANNPIPKVSIRVNRVQIPLQKHENQIVTASSIQSSPAAGVLLQTPAYQVIQPQNGNEALPDDSQTFSAEDLINELVDMASAEPNRLTNLISTFDESVVQAGMDELLSQLDSCDTKASASDVAQWTSDSVTPVTISSPVPSAGSLSPQSDIDQSFHHSPPHTIDDATICLEDNDTSFTSVMSPYSEDSITISSPSYTEDEFDMEYSKTELHSYSRPSSKRKNARKSGRGSSFPEGRKERKKEQNKQAALRYRQKKKQEDDELMDRIKSEEERQKKLKAKYTSLKQELNCLKKIMREVLIAKGTLSPKAFEKK